MSAVSINHCFISFPIIVESNGGAHFYFRQWWSRDGTPYVLAALCPARVTKGMQRVFYGYYLPVPYLHFYRMATVVRFTLSRLFALFSDRIKQNCVD